MSVAEKNRFKETAIGWIPATWDCVSQSEVVTFHNGRAYKLTEWETEGTPVIRLQNLTGSGETYYYSNLKLPPHQYVNKDDLLFMWSATFGPHIWRGQKAIYHYHIWKIDCSERVDRSYMFYSLSRFTEEMKNKTNGSTMLHLTKAGMEKESIALPPLPEQQKIAAILKAVDDKLGVIARQIETIQALKQGLMQSLFSQCAADWPTVQLQEVAEVRTGVAKGKKGLKEPTELPYLRVANVQDGHIDLTEVKTIAVEAIQVERYALQPGDVLMTEGGDFDKLGRGDVWEGQISPCLHQNHVFAVRPAPSKLNSYYLAALAASDYGRQYFLSCAKRTTNLASINSSQLKTFPVLFPPLDEQVRIAEIVAAANARIETLSTKKAHYQTLKRGLMQKLLTGEWRVKLDSPSGTA